VNCGSTERDPIAVARAFQHVKSVLNQASCGVAERGAGGRRAVNRGLRIAVKVTDFCSADFGTTELRLGHARSRRLSLAALV
jgi:hypothetical protein